MEKGRVYAFVLDAAKAQAGARPMGTDEIVRFIRELLEKMLEFEREVPAAFAEERSPLDSIGEDEVSCLICGESFKILSARHLKKHGLSPEEYKNRYGIPPDMSLICRSLSRQKSDSINACRIWEKRGK